MLRHLRLNNFILVDHGEIDFDQGFTVLSGETGAGKSAILKALRLVFGGQADREQIRKGADKGSVEASFDITTLPPVQRLLDDVGIAYEKGEPLIIRRHLSAAGTSRSYVNDQMVQRALLQQLSRNLIDFVGQHANQRLLDLDYHREVVDLYGRIETTPFANSFSTFAALQKELADLSRSEAERLRDIQRLQSESEELAEAKLQEGEEEELYAEYVRLSNAEELTGEVDLLIKNLENELLPRTRQADHSLGKITSLDESLSPLSQGIQTAAAELEETTFQLNRYRQTLAFNPERQLLLDERLKLYTSLKRKYGPELNDVLAYQTQITERLATLENADLRIEELQSDLANAKAECDRLAALLTQERQQAAKQLESELERHLHPLNMQGARFELQMTQKERSPSGDDAIEIAFAPNVGERMVSLRECASGGELSRILLALKTVLAGLELTPTLMFDEIDANIGGETATLVAEKLASIATKRQVLCITHLPQVARQAAHHIRIAKETRDGRTFTTLTPLSSKDREKELQRMMG